MKHKIIYSMQSTISTTLMIDIFCLLVVYSWEKFFDYQVGYKCFVVNNNRNIRDKMRFSFSCNKERRKMLYLNAIDVK